MIDDLRNTINQATELLGKQTAQIAQYDLLCKTQDEAIGQMSKAVHALAAICANVARLTDDPEIQHEILKALAVCEQLQEEAVESLKKIEGLDD
jgi:hypothetical protein